MIYPVAHIVKDVRVAIDRNRRNSDLLDIDINTQMLDESIVRHIIDGARIVLSSAPLSSLGEGKDFAGDVEWGDGCSGRLSLPLDYLRLLVFKMSDWAYGVEVLLPSGDILYKRMRSPIKALRGVSERPYAFDVLTSVGRVLEFYSCDSEAATVEVARYVPLPMIEYRGVMTMPFAGIDSGVEVIEGVAPSVSLLFYLSDRNIFVAMYADYDSATKEYIRDYYTDWSGSEGYMLTPGEAGAIRTDIAFLSNADEYYYYDKVRETLVSFSEVSLDERQGFIDIPLRCYRACVSEIAALVMLERGASDLAQALETEAKSLIE